MPRAMRFQSQLHMNLAFAGKEASTKPMQMKFRLPEYLQKLIEEGAERAGDSASEEIRARLEGSYLKELIAPDDETYRLVGAVESIARNVNDAFGPWHENRFAFDTFRSAVLAVIDLHRPTGVPIRPEEGGIADMYLGEDGTPETAGRMLAGAAAVATGIDRAMTARRAAHVEPKRPRRAANKGDANQ
jgi:hypothetical protein